MGRKKKTEESDTEGKEKKKKERVWKHCSREAYLRSIQHLVHFSSKEQNTGSLITGIRLKSDAGLDLPYVCARTLMAEGREIPLDSVLGGASGLAPSIQAVKIRDGETADAAEDEIESVRMGFEAMTDGCEFGTEQVSAHLKQVCVSGARVALLEKVVVAYIGPATTENAGSIISEGTQELSLTPLAAFGVCALLRDAVKASNEAADADHRKIRCGTLQFGGSKPQNAGMLVYAGYHPIVMTSPRTKMSLRNALRVHRTGPNLNIRYFIRKYADFRSYYGLDTTEKTPHKWERTQLLTRLSEREMLHDIVTELLSRGDQVRDIVVPHIDRMPNRQYTSDSLDPDIRALVDRSLCTPGWDMRMANRVVDQMLAMKTEEGEPVFNIDQSAVLTVYGILKGGFRCAML